MHLPKWLIVLVAEMMMKNRTAKFTSPPTNNAERNKKNGSKTSACQFFSSYWPTNISINNFLTIYEIQIQETIKTSSLKMLNIWMLAMFLHMVFKGKKWKMAKKIQGKTYHTQKSLYVKNQQFLCKILENIKKPTVVVLKTYWIWRDITQRSKR